MRMGGVWCVLPRSHEEADFHISHFVIFKCVINFDKVFLD